CLISLVTAVIEPVARLRTERSEVMTIYTISGGCFAPSDENLNHRKLFFLVSPSFFFNTEGFFLKEQSQSLHHKG
ncbi:MAG: hypothetical protein K6E78_01020, partial [Treponema sp.]|nr:hypothetical protein [Treponema sp.]